MSAPSSPAPASDAPLATKITEEVKHEVRELEQGEIDTVETPARYLAYLARYKNLFVASSRYLAYSSDVGEAFRPITTPVFVNAMYGGKSRSTPIRLMGDSSAIFPSFQSPCTSSYSPFSLPPS